MTFQCNNAPGQCIKVYYERLIQKPAEEILRITNFLDLPFSQQMLRHQDLIGDEVDLNEYVLSSLKLLNFNYLLILQSRILCITS